MTLPLHEQIRRDFDRKRAVGMVRLRGGDYVNYDPATCTFTALSFNKPMDETNRKTFEGCIRRGGLEHSQAVAATHNDQYGGHYQGFSWVLSLADGAPTSGAASKAHKTEQMSLL